MEQERELFYPSSFRSETYIALLKELDNLSGLVTINIPPLTGLKHFASRSLGAGCLRLWLNDAPAQ